MVGNTSPQSSRLETLWGVIDDNLRAPPGTGNFVAFEIRSLRTLISPGSTWTCQTGNPAAEDRAYTA